VYIGIKTNSTYKTANILSPKNVNTNLKVGYLKCQRLIDVCSYGTWSSVVRLGTIWSDGSDCSVRYFDVPPISMGTLLVKCMFNNASSPGVPNKSPSTLFPYFAGSNLVNNLPMQCVQSYCSSCAHGFSSEFRFRYCDIHIMQLLKVIGMTLQQTLGELTVL